MGEHSAQTPRIVVQWLKTYMFWDHTSTIMAHCPLYCTDSSPCDLDLFNTKFRIQVEGFGTSWWSLVILWLHLVLYIAVHFMAYPKTSVNSRCPLECTERLLLQQGGVKSLSHISPSVIFVKGRIIWRFIEQLKSKKWLCLHFTKLPVQDVHHISFFPIKPKLWTHARLQVGFVPHYHWQKLL